MNMPENPTADVKAVNQRFYDRLWSRAKLIAPERFNTWPKVQELLPTHPRRLEIAPGMRPRLPIPGTQFIDISQPALDALEQAGGLTQCAELNALPHADAAFDLVALFDVIEHVEDDRGAIREVARVLRPGGHFMLSVPLHPANWTAFDAIVGHWRRYAPDELTLLLEEAGLQIELCAVYGMKPRSSWLVDLGMWFLEHRTKSAMWWYNLFMPLTLRRQPPLTFTQGLIDDPAVDEVIIVGTRVA